MCQIWSHFQPNPLVTTARGPALLYAMIARESRAWDAHARHITTYSTSSETHASHRMSLSCVRRPIFTSMAITHGWDLMGGRRALGTGRVCTNDLHGRTLQLYGAGSLLENCLRHMSLACNVLSCEIHFAHVIRLLLRGLTPRICPSSGCT